MSDSEQHEAEGDHATVGEGPGSVPEHFVVAEINGIRITSKPRTFRPDAVNDLMDIEEADCVDKERVVSYE